MRRFFMIVPLCLLLMTLAFIGWKAIPSSFWKDANRNTAEGRALVIITKCDSLITENRTLLERVRVLENHVYGAGL